MLNGSIAHTSIYPSWISRMAVTMDALFHSYLATIRLNEIIIKY